MDAMMKAERRICDTRSRMCASIDRSDQEMASAPRSLDELDHADHRNAPWLVFVDLAESHGRPDVSRLAVLAEHPNARALRISGLDQRSFEHLVASYGRQFPAIEFS